MEFRAKSGVTCARPFFVGLVKTLRRLGARAHPLVRRLEPPGPIRASGGVSGAGLVRMDNFRVRMDNSSAAMGVTRRHY